MDLLPQRPEAQVTSSASGEARSTDSSSALRLSTVSYFHGCSRGALTRNLNMVGETISSVSYRVLQEGEASGVVRGGIRGRVTHLEPRGTEILEEELLESVPVTTQLNTVKAAVQMPQSVRGLNVDTVYQEHRLELSPTCTPAQALAHNQMFPKLFIHVPLWRKEMCVTSWWHFGPSGPH